MAKVHRGAARLVDDGDRHAGQRAHLPGPDPGDPARTCSGPARRATHHDTTEEDGNGGGGHDGRTGPRAEPSAARQPAGDPGVGRHPGRGRRHARRRAGQGRRREWVAHPGAPASPASRSPGRPPPTTAWPSTWTPCRRPCTGCTCCSRCPPAVPAAPPGSAPSPRPRLSVTGPTAPSRQLHHHRSRRRVRRRRPGAVPPAGRLEGPRGRPGVRGRPRRPPRRPGPARARGSRRARSTRRWPASSPARWTRLRPPRPADRRPACAAAGPALRRQHLRPVPTRGPPPGPARAGRRRRGLPPPAAPPRPAAAGRHPADAA